MFGVEEEGEGEAGMEVEEEEEEEVEKPNEARSEGLLAVSFFSGERMPAVAKISSMRALHFAT